MQRVALDGQDQRPPAERLGREAAGEDDGGERAESRGAGTAAAEDEEAEEGGEEGGKALTAALSHSSRTRERDHAPSPVARAMGEGRGEGDAVRRAPKIRCATPSGSWKIWKFQSRRTPQPWLAGARSRAVSRASPC